jgi:tetrahydromethanopterin S-methyltransferase subunit E
MDLLKTLQGDGTVNKFQRATMETVSQWTNVTASLLGSSQHAKKLGSSNHMTCFLCGPCGACITGICFGLIS